MSDSAPENLRHTSDSDAWFTPPEIIEAARATMGGIDLDPASCARANEHVRATQFFDKEANGFTRPWHGKVFLNPPGGHCDADGLRVVRGKKGQPGCEVSGACGLPPGHLHRGPTQSAAKAWWNLLATQWVTGAVECAVFIGFSIEILQTTQIGRMRAADALSGKPVLVHSAAEGLLCFPKTRLSFLQEGSNGKLVPVKGNTHASVIVGLAPRTAEHFEVLRVERRRAMVSAFARSFASIGVVRE
jgi:hypothetical protein